MDLRASVHAAISKSKHSCFTISSFGHLILQFSASLYFILFHIHTCWGGVVCLNTGMLPALAQQVMKNRQILSDGFR